MSHPSLAPWSLRGNLPADLHVDMDARSDENDLGFDRIRCPLCFWQPNATSLWRCACVNTPEVFFNACGTIWNTFATRGRCPGCQHQWKWTGCLWCGLSSLHEDWYESNDAGRSH